MKLTLKIWRQKNATAKGNFETYKMDNVSPKMAFLEMLDALNKRLVEEDKDPVAFDTIAVKGSAVHAGCILMVIHTDLFRQ